MKKIHLLILASMSVSAFTQNVGGTDQNEKAQQLQINAITTAVPFLNISPDARSAGLGECGAGIVSDPNALFWNTATLGFSGQRASFTASYSPWLRQLVDDIHLFNAAGYVRLGKRHAIGGMYKHFSLGQIHYTNQLGQLISVGTPKENEFLLGYALKASKKSSFGVNFKYFNSDLGDGIPGAKAAHSYAVDVSYAYMNKGLKLFKRPLEVRGIVTISNLGPKLAYTSDADQDFIPANLKLGGALVYDPVSKHTFRLVMNINKLMVPTQPAWAGTSGVILAGMNPDVPVPHSWVQSFHDAPGRVDITSSGDTTFTGQALEEFREYNWQFGLEHTFMNMFSLRTGLFWEHLSKGGRQFLTFGTGIKWGNLMFDVAYYAAFNRQNPLANTMKFTAIFNFPLERDKWEKKRWFSPFQKPY